MNILYLISFAGSAGTEKYVENLMGIAAREGHRCHLGYCVPGPLYEKAERAGYPTLRLNMSPRRVPAAALQPADAGGLRGRLRRHAEGESVSGILEFIQRYNGIF